MNPNFKKKKPLPYKNLGELYIEAVQGEPSINRFFETKDYEVYIGKRNDPKDTKGFEVDEPTAEKITRIIKNIDDNTEELIKDLLEQSGFSSDGDILTLTVEAFLKQNINSKELEKVIQQKKDKELTLFEDKLNSEGVYNIKEVVLTPVVIKFTDTPRELIDKLFNVKPPKNTIGVGPGEVCIALFTNCKKGEKGDLICGDKKVEIKASGGRVYTSGYSLNFPEYAKTILKTRASIVQSKYVNTIKEALQKIKTDINYKNIIGLNDYIESVKSSIDNAQIELEKIKELIQQGEKIYELRLSRVIKYELNRIINALKNSMKFLLSGKTPAWGQTVQDFFFNHPLSREQIINGLIELRSEPDGNLKSLRAALNEIITDNNYFREDGRKKLDRLTLAIQTASYQCHEKFDCLLVINSSYNTLSLSFNSTKDVGASFKQMFNYIETYKLETNFAVDTKFKGISINLP